MNNYGLDIWGDDNFIIDNGVLKVNYSSKPSLISIVNDIRSKGNKGPITLRFPHLTIKQINKLYNTFDKSINEYNYTGKFNAVFPLKVNQLPNFIHPMLENSKHLSYGLEAGSKAELILAMAYNNIQCPIIVNGFKDKDMITLAFIAKSLGHDISLILEGINELETIIEVQKELDLPSPSIGLRVRLHSGGSGTWAKSGGINSKFGLSATEILDAYEMMKKYNLLDKFTMIHFHIGSAMKTITPLKKALKESGHIYAQLKTMGATNLNAINIGGGLFVEYSQSKSTKEYSLDEFCSDVVFTLQSIAKNKNVKEPNIFIESGRYVSASNSILIAPVLELFSNDYGEGSLRLKSHNPEIVTELYALYNEMEDNTAREFMHDALEHLESILTLFDLGYVDLQDRSNSEILVNLIIKKAIILLEIDNYSELRSLEERIQEKYLLNFSIFQSLPDFWGIGQQFPIMPITHLDKPATRSATLWDITCDSDGEIPFNQDEPLYLHDIDLSKEDYFIAFFLTGAYQDILGMRHNLFVKPHEVNIKFLDDGSYKLDNFLKSQKILDIFDDLDFDTKQLQNNLFSKLQSSKDIKLLKILKSYLEDNSYLKT
jgi:arginine decarboxylase